MIKRLKHQVFWLGLPLMTIAAAGTFAKTGHIFQTPKAEKHSAASCATAAEGVFNRIATFPVCKLLDEQCNTDIEYAAEIVSSDSSGNTLIFTNSPANEIGFVDIRNPHAPAAAGSIALNGEPTSVGTKDDYALVAVNLSEDYINTAGELVVVDVNTQSVVHTLDLGGQPDSVAISPDQSYAVIAIENERDEDLDDGIIPQLPAGYVVVVDIADADPKKWTLRTVDVVGLAEIAPEDPEPEYVDINSDNIAVVTLQENNHIVLIDLKSCGVINHFSAGFVDLDNIDTEEEEPALINPIDSQNQVPREPDGVSWIDTQYLVTADEGDYNGGSRGFTVFKTNGEVAFSSGNDLDMLSITLGHYPDSRSGNKGNEPENVEFAIFGDTPYLFVASERSSLLFVYDVQAAEFPTYKQALPAAAGPEGVLALPQRNLVIAASEEDNRGDKLRSSLNIYEYQRAPTNYPNIASGYRRDGSPIAWSALSGLSASVDKNSVVYAVDDSYYRQNRIIKMHIRDEKGYIKSDMKVRDPLGLLAKLSAEEVNDELEADAPERLEVFDSLDRAALFNEDATVNLDLEGIAATKDGFWLVSEGSGTVGDESRPINSLNLLIKTNKKAEITEVITLPEALNSNQLRFGFEGVAVDKNKIVVAFQRAWNGEDHPRLGIYDTSNKEWQFVFYPLDAAQSNAGGWVGLSDISALGNDRYLVLERDNQAGPDAATKRLYKIDLNQTDDEGVLAKQLVKDLMPMLSSQASPVPEKLEGLAITKDGRVIINNDNDGVDDNSGENILLIIKDVLSKK